MTTEQAYAKMVMLSKVEKESIYAHTGIRKAYLGMYAHKTERFTVVADTIVGIGDSYETAIEDWKITKEGKRTLIVDRLKKELAILDGE